MLILVLLNAVTDTAVCCARYQRAFGCCYVIFTILSLGTDIDNIFELIIIFHIMLLYNIYIFLKIFEAWFTGCTSFTTSDICVLSDVVILVVLSFATNLNDGFELIVVFHIMLFYNICIFLRNLNRDLLVARRLPPLISVFFRTPLFYSFYH